MLYDDSFEQLLARDDLPQFDSIRLHGIWTSVSRDNQKLIVEFACGFHDHPDTHSTNIRTLIPR